MNVSNKVCNNVLNVCLSELERVNNFCYLGDNMNGGGGSELAVTRRIGLGWKAFNSIFNVVVKDTHGISKKKFIEHV